MSRRVLGVMVAFFVLAAAAWWFFLISPRNSRVADLGDQLQTAVAEGDSLRLAVAALRDVQDNDVAFLAAIGQMEAGIPEEPELAVFIEEVTALAAATGISLQSISPSEPSPSAEIPVYEITVSIAMQGEYFELLDFLFRLDDMERIVVVQTVSVAPGGGEGGVVEELEEEATTTTTTVAAATTTTTTVAGQTTTTSSSTTTTSTTTTTTVPVLQENPLQVSLTVKIYTRSPLLPSAAVTLPGSGGGGEDAGDAGGQASDGGAP